MLKKLKDCVDNKLYELDKSIINYKNVKNCIDNNPDEINNIIKLIDGNEIELVNELLFGLFPDIYYDLIFILYKISNNDMLINKNNMIIFCNNYVITN